MPVAVLRCALPLLACCCVLAAPAAAPAAQRLVLLGPRHARPLPDAAAARLVHRSTWEPRDDNRVADRRRPTAHELRAFRARSDMPLARYVTGDFTGTTDEILQWGAYKWGFSPNLFRAVATVETWWHQDFVGDGGHSFGLMQVRVPYHCCLPEIRDSTAFNVDYYGAILRAYYDGLEGFLGRVAHGRPYRAGDLWGSVGVWASGRWHAGTADAYAEQVRERLADRVWTTADFAGG